MIAEKLRALDARFGDLEDDFEAFDDEVASIGCLDRSAYHDLPR
jgi:hypothetical protein